ncbi:MAG: hypothetical protein KME59_19310 [Trichormus sp. ATA11-4-KO1]|nr:hypothetical protein [Trichormus sp. ATA11-4-KO1]
MIKFAVLGLFVEKPRSLVCHQWRSPICGKLRSRKLPTGDTNLFFE